MKKRLIPNCSETIQKLEVTDEEKNWLIRKAEELNLTKDKDETGLVCFLSESEKIAGVDQGQWMNETFDERWRDFTTLKTLLLVKRETISMKDADLSEEEKTKRAIENEEQIITSMMGSDIAYSTEAVWKRLHEHLTKYFQLKNLQDYERRKNKDETN